MNNIVTDINGENKLVYFTNNIIGNYYVNSFFIKFPTQIHPYPQPSFYSEIDFFSQTNTSCCINFFNSNLNNQFWILYFDRSKSDDSAYASCILQSPNGEKIMLTCRLEFQCMNNVVEYEALIQALRKQISMNVKSKEYNTLCF